MKKRIVPFLILALSLLWTSIGDASYLLRLKNKGRVVTPMYWVEGDKIYFSYAGGVAGMEKEEIDKIEKLKTEDGEYIYKTPAIAGKKELPPSPSQRKKRKNRKHHRRSRKKRWI